jgi:hypothetical protein
VKFWELVSVCIAEPQLLIRHAARVASQRRSAVIADIAASAAEAIERRTYREPDVLSVGIPVPLARRVLAIVNGGTC